MTETEARQIARVVGTADSGCSHCVGQLVEQLNERELGWTFIKTGKVLHVRPLWDDEYRQRFPYVKVQPHD